MADNRPGLVHSRPDGKPMRVTKATMRTMPASMRSEMKRINALNLEPAVTDLKAEFKKYQSRVQSVERCTDLKAEFKQSLDLLKKREAQKIQHGHQPKPEALDAAIATESKQSVDPWSPLARLAEFKQSLDLIKEREAQKTQQRHQQTPEALGYWPTSPPCLSTPSGTSVEAARTLTEEPQADATSCPEEARKLSKDTEETSSSESIQDYVVWTDERAETPTTTANTTTRSDFRSFSQAYHHHS